MEPPYFAVSARKFVVMNACTFALYQYYWIYKVWQSVRLRDKSDLSPTWRTVFIYFYCYSLFSRIRETAQQNNINVQLAAGPLAAGWIILSLAASLPDPYWLVSLAAFVLVLPVRSVVALINDKLAPGHDRNERFSIGNVVTIVIGAGLWVLVGAALLLPGQ